jgi:hypothetical protein
MDLMTASVDGMDVRVEELARLEITVLRRVLAVVITGRTASSSTESSVEGGALEYLDAHVCISAVAVFGGLDGAVAEGGWTGVARGSGDGVADVAVGAGDAGDVC